MERTRRPASEKSKIWAIGGGKGGVGKSVISILLSMALARSGEQTILVDLDLGGANIHTLMGVKTPTRTLNDFISRKYRSIEDICVRTAIENLQLVFGTSEILSSANPYFSQKYKIVKHILNLPARHVILDLGAGTSYNVLDFFLIADNPIIVLTPQPISIQNAYAFVRNTVYRKFSRIAAQQASLQNLIKTAMDPKNEKKMRTILDLYHLISKEYGKNRAQQFKDAIAEIRPMVITNMTRDHRDNNAGKIIQLVAEKYLTIHTEEAGAVSYDPLIETMVSQMTPMPQLPEESRAGKDMAAMIGKLMGKELN